MMNFFSKSVDIVVSLILTRRNKVSASSVSGVGQGSADKAGQRGSEHLFVGVEKLVGPRVVRAGSVAVATGGSPTSTVVFPEPLSGVASDYAVFLGPCNAAGTATAVLSVVPGSGVAIPTQSGTETSGSATITGLTSTAILSVGMSVTGTGIPASTTIASIVSATSLTLSAAATGTGAQTLTFGATGTYPLAGFSFLAGNGPSTVFWEVVRVNNATVQVN